MCATYFSEFNLLYIKAFANVVLLERITARNDAAQRMHTVEIQFYQASNMMVDGLKGFSAKGFRCFICVFRLVIFEEKPRLFGGI